MYINQKTNRIFEAFCKTVSFLNVITYPIEKAVALGENTSNKSSKFTGVLKFISALNYTNKLLSFLDLLYTILDIDNEKNEKEVLCIKITYLRLQMFKTIAIAILIILLLFYLLDLFLIKKEERKLAEGISAFLNVVLSLYGLFFYVMNIADQFSGRKWTTHFTNELLSNLILSLRFTELDSIKKGLAKAEYAYPVVYGAISIINAVELGTSFFMKKNISYIREDNFKAVETEENALFVYFCGKNEETNLQTFQLMQDIKAKHHIYIAGVGAQNLTYVKEYTDCIEPNEEKVGKNTTIFKMSHAKREIHCIEKIYNGYRYYTTDDAEKVAKYTYERVKKILQANPNINKVVFAGLGEGAAVGLSAFATKISSSNSDLDVVYKQLWKSGRIAFFFLDPTDGNDGSRSDYHKGFDNTSYLYQSLRDSVKDDSIYKYVAINEIWACATRDKFSSAEWLNTDDFTPAKKFLQKDTYVKRFEVGYTHYGLTNDKSESSEYYNKCDGSEPCDKAGPVNPGRMCDGFICNNEYKCNPTPYKLVVNFMNEYFNPNVKNIDTDVYKDRFDGINSDDKLRNKFGIFGAQSKLLRDNNTYKTDKNQDLRFKDFINPR